MEIVSLGITVFLLGIFVGMVRGVMKANPYLTILEAVEVASNLIIEKIGG